MPLTRYAPSPTGRLHLGHAYAAWIAHLNSGDSGFLLRIEDIDYSRCKVEYVVGILEDLEWLGLKWKGDVVFQSQREPIYRAALEALKSRDLVYPCFCTRAEVMAAAGAPHGDEGPVYPGTCRGLSHEEATSLIEEGKEYCFRLNLAACLEQVEDISWMEIEFGRLSADPARFGDVVIAQKDSGLSYFLCSTLDDAKQGIELVTRGDDLRNSTVIQRILQSLLGLPEPEYFHHALVVDENGKRLAKRFDSLSVKTLREQGLTASQVFELATKNLRVSPV